MGQSGRLSDRIAALHAFIGLVSPTAFAAEQARHLGEGLAALDALRCLVAPTTGVAQLGLDIGKGLTTLDTLGGLSGPPAVITEKCLSCHPYILHRWVTAGRFNRLAPVP